MDKKKKDYFSSTLATPNSLVLQHWSQFVHGVCGKSLAIQMCQKAKQKKQHGYYIFAIIKSWIIFEKRCKGPKTGLKYAKLFASQVLFPSLNKNQVF